MTKARATRFRCTIPGVTSIPELSLLCADCLLPMTHEDFPQPHACATQMPVETHRLPTTGWKTAFVSQSSRWRRVATLPRPLLPSRVTADTALSGQELPASFQLSPATSRKLKVNASGVMLKQRGTHTAACSPHRSTCRLLLHTLPKGPQQAPLPIDGTCSLTHPLLAFLLPWGYFQILTMLSGVISPTTCTKILYKGPLWGKSQVRH